MAENEGQNAPASSMARTSYPSPSYETPDMTHLSPPYQFNPMTFPSSSNQLTPMTHPSPAYQHAHSTPINESGPVVHSSPTYQATLEATSAAPATVRGRGRQKGYWEESETQLLIEVLQEMACDPSWKTENGFRSNYMAEVQRRILVKRPTFSKKVSPHIESKVKWLKTKFHVISDMLKYSGCQWNDVDKKIACERDWYLKYCENHKEANGLWDFPFPYFNQLELVYGRDRATGTVVEGFKDAIHNMENEQNGESGGDNIGGSHISLSDDEEVDVQYMSQTTQTTSNFTNGTNMAKKQKVTSNGKQAAKKRKTRDMESQLEGINHSFQMFVQGFNANFGTMANVVANAMTDDNNRKKAKSEQLKDALDELTKLNIPSGDVLHAAEIFADHKDKLELFLNLSQPLRVSYVLKLTRVSSDCGVFADSAAHSDNPPARTKVEFKVQINAAHSDIHNGCSTQPRHTSCMTNIVSTEARELHCHIPEQVQLNKRNSQFTLGGRQNAFAERKNLINNHVTQCNTCICHNVKCSPATQFRCSRQKKIATKPNCGQQQPMEADGKQICTLQKDSAERLDDNNAQATSQVTVVPCVDRCDKPHAKRTHRQTSDEIQKNSRPDISVIDTDGMEKRHGFRLCRYKQFIDPFPPMTVQERYTNEEQEQTRNHWSTEPLLKVNPQNYQRVRFTTEATILEINSTKLLESTPSNKPEDQYCET
ncbi:Myb/SANT-like domain-containing protein [Tanacetum coccineum]